MKKILKALLCMALALIMAFGPMTAFASNGDTLKWYSYDGDETPYEYVRGSEIFLGENKVKPNFTGDDEYIYHEFKAEKSGYYLVTYSSMYLFYVDVAEKVDASGAHGYKDYERLEDLAECDTRVLYYFEEGEIIFGADYSYSQWSENKFDDCVIDIEFYGEITDYEFDEKTLEGLIIGFNIDFDTKAGDRTYIEMNAEFYFETGKALEINEHYFTCNFKNDAVTGENELTVSLAGYEMDITVTAYPIEHFIESVTLENAGKYAKVMRDFKGEINYDWNLVTEDKKITVKYTDREVKEINHEFSVAIPVGNRYCFVNYLYKDNENGGVDFVVELAGKEYLSVPCEVTEFTFEENSHELKTTVKNEFYLDYYEAADSFKQAFTLRYNYSPDFRLELLADAISGFSGIPSMVFGYVFTFIKYYSAVA